MSAVMNEQNYEGTGTVRQSVSQPGTAPVMFYVLILLTPHFSILGYFLTDQSLQVCESERNTFHCIKHVTM